MAASRSPLQTPALLGFRMPAEWEPHDATWLAWPHQRSDWPGKFAAIPWVYVEIVRYLAEVEPVRILVQDAQAERRAAAHLRRGGARLDRVEFWRIPTDRSWIRDYGPIFLRRDEVRESRVERQNARKEPRSAGLSTPDSRLSSLAVTDWRFNAWAKYRNWRHDDAVPAKIAHRLRLPCWQPVANPVGPAVPAKSAPSRKAAGPTRVVLEGGSIDVDGRGTLLTTEQCLLSNVQARNPGMAREQLEQVLAHYLDARRVVWLGRGIAGDDTHGHVDDIARFVAPGRVVAAFEDDPSDENHQPLRENYDRLRHATNAAGSRLEVIAIPMPRYLGFDGRRLPASYANFYVANQIVLVPTFNDPHDARAIGILSELFPDRTVVGIHSIDLIWGLGALHCLSMQQPLAPGP